MKKIFLLLFFGYSLILNAQTFRNYSNEFMNIGVDASALGMSKAVVASSNDVNSGYWNPAGLTQIEDFEGSLMHASYFAGISNYNFASFAMPIDDLSYLGVSVIRFGVDDILNTTELIDQDGNIDFNRVSLFSAADYAFTVSYARKILFTDLSFGMNAKVVRRIIGDFATSFGFGFDAGLQFERNNWKFGLMVRDITTTFNSWNINEEEFNKIRDAVPGQNQELPETTELTKPKIQFGTAKIFNLKNEISLLAEVDLNIRLAETNDIISSEAFSIDPAIGLQADYDDIVFLRLGIGNMQYIREFDDSQSLSIQPNFGVGFKYNGIQIDYALTNIGSVGNALFSNIFSLKIDYSFFRK